MKLYVGTLPWSTTDAELEELFAAIGPVDSARVITDRETGRSREGFLHTVSFKYPFELPVLAFV